MLEAKQNDDSWAVCVCVCVQGESGIFSVTTNGPELPGNSK